MSPRGTRQTRIHRVETRLYSPDDIKARLIEAQDRELADTRTEAQRWLGEPPPRVAILAMINGDHNEALEVSIDCCRTISVPHLRGGAASNSGSMSN
jgi:hypothetical protein